jgi:hypothetical protein
MKKLLFLPTLFLFIACIQPKKTDPAHDSKLMRQALSNYVQIGNMQQAWTKSYVNLLFWIHNPGSCAQKEELKRFIQKDYPEMRLQMKKMESDPQCGPECTKLIGQMDALMAGYKNTVDALHDFASYNDPSIMLTLESFAFDDDGENLFRFEQLSKEFETAKADARTFLDLQLK